MALDEWCRDGYGRWSIPLVPAIMRAATALFALALVALAPVPARAGLDFPKDRLVLNCGPADDQMDADFPFTNKGASPVTIVSIISGCQCLEAEAPEGEIAPGAQGKVHSVFKVGAFNGMVEKQLVVRWEEGGVAHDTVLTVAVVIPELIRIEPTTLVWDVGGAAQEQSYRVLMVWNEPIRLLTVDCSRPEFDFRAETVKDGREYLVRVKPTKLDQPLLGLFQFKTDCKFEKFRNPMGFVHVRRPVAAP